MDLAHHIDLSDDDIKRSAEILFYRQVV